MEENKENTTNNQKMNAEEIKKEAADTVNQVKETIKTTDLKKDANEAKGFFTNFFKNPVGEIDIVAHSSKNQFLKIGIAILVVWLVATFLNEMISVFKSYSYYTNFSWFFKNFITNILSVIKGVIAPLLSIIVLSGAIYFVKKEERKSFTHIASTVLIAKTPIVIACVANLLGIFSSQVYKLVNPFSAFCSVISTVLLYFSVKYLYDEKEDTTAIKKFAIIMAIFYVAKFILNFLEIYI